MISVKYRKRSDKKSGQMEKWNKKLSRALCIVFFLPGINYFINCVAKKGIGLNVLFITPISYLVMAAVSVFFLYTLIVRRKKFVFLFVFFVFLSVVSYLIYSEIREIIYDSPFDLIYSIISR